MRWRRILRLRARNRGELKGELGDELRFHFDMRVAELKRAGMSASDAEQQARLAFGDVDRFTALCLEEDTMKLRDERRALWHDELVQDIRFAGRTLVRDRAFALLSVLTLALAIGLNTAVFTVVDRLLLRALPYPEPERLVSIALRSESGGFEVDIVRLNEQTGGKLRVGGWSGWGFTLTGAGEPQALDGAAVSTSLFDVLGVRPALGRGFLERDVVPGQRVAILSYGLWQSTFGGDPGIIGRSITLDGAPMPVVGVMPAGFAFPSREAQIWLPVIYEDGQPPTGFGMGLVGRLGPGVTVDAAGSLVRSAVVRIKQDNPDLQERFGRVAGVRPLRDALVGEFRAGAWILFAATGFVLLIACVNVANLLLTRAAGRSGEFAVRASLGASRGRLVRQLVTESAVLALLAAGIGFLLARAGVGVLVGWLPRDVVGFAELHADARVLGYSVVLALMTVLLFGVAPALLTPLGCIASTLRAAGRSGGGIRRGPLRVLVATEIALAVVLGTGAALMLHSFWRLRTEASGFEEARVLTMKLSPPDARFQEPAASAQLARDIIERIEALPGVAAAGEIHILPLGGSNWNPGLIVEGRVLARAQDAPSVDWRVVTPGYFGTMLIPLRSGRLFTPRDIGGAERVALVNETLARQQFAGESPVGRRIRTAFEGENWVTIVGVVGDTRDQALGDAAHPQMYRPHAQWTLNTMVLMVRGERAPMALVPAIRSAVAGVHPEIAISDVQPFSAVVGASVAQPRLLTALLTTFGAVALLLGGLGVYGVIAYTVNRRRREFGIRSALGATPGDLRRLVLGEGVRTTLVGVALGLLGAALLSGTLSSQLHEVQPLEPVTFVAVALVVSMMALLAMAGPARRAAAAQERVFQDE